MIEVALATVGEVTELPLTVTVAGAAKLVPVIDKLLFTVPVQAVIVGAGTAALTVIAPVA
ncbi:MAG TPA: hypothetical protein VFV17_02540 [Usitatibacteraceae bacterium]|nr:hypothetical protein [Usitatibacteraceae bacterium]